MMIMIITMIIVMMVIIIVINKSNYNNDNNNNNYDDFIIIFVIRILTVLLLCSVHQGQRSHATSLAEKYHDFGVLIELCETSGEQGTLQKYMTQFTDQVGMSIKPPSENVNDSLNSKCVFCCKRWSES